MKKSKNIPKNADAEKIFFKNMYVCFNYRKSVFNLRFLEILEKKLKNAFVAYPQQIYLEKTQVRAINQCSGHIAGQYLLFKTLAFPMALKQFSVKIPWLLWSLKNIL